MGSNARLTHKPGSVFDLSGSPLAQDSTGLSLFAGGSLSTQRVRNPANPDLPGFELSRVYKLTPASRLPRTRRNLVWACKISQPLATGLLVIEEVLEMKRNSTGLESS